MPFSLSNEISLYIHSAFHLSILMKMHLIAIMQSQYKDYDVYAIYVDLHSSKKR
jgi:hypothetical protein